MISNYDRYQLKMGLRLSHLVRSITTFRLTIPLKKFVIIGITVKINEFGKRLPPGLNVYLIFRFSTGIGVNYDTFAGIPNNEMLVLGNDLYIFIILFLFWMFSIRMVNTERMFDLEKI